MRREDSNPRLREEKWEQINRRWSRFLVKKNRTEDITGEKEENKGGKDS